MKKEKLQSLIEKGMSQRQMAEQLDTSHSNIRYWLKKHNLKTGNKPFVYGTRVSGDEKKCTTCHETKKLNEFYIRSDNGYHMSSCKKCQNKYYTQRMKGVKIKMIEYKGCQCERCKLRLQDSHYAVFEFHHKNPEEKDPNFAKIKFQKWEVIKKEIDKCQLLCANCHREVHAEIEGW